MAEILASIITLGLFTLIFFGPPALIILLIVKLVRKSDKKKAEKRAKTQPNPQYNPPYVQAPYTQQTQNPQIKQTPPKPAQPTLTVQHTPYGTYTVPKQEDTQKQNAEQKPIYKSQNADTYNSTVQYPKFFFDNEKDKIDEQYDNAYLPYKRCNLLTKRELSFYIALKTIADEKNLTVLSKIRVADLVQVQAYGSERQVFFNKVSRKHVDFALANPKNLEIVLLIELDDHTHDDNERYKRDKFIESVYEKTGYKLLKIRSSENLQKRIDEILSYQ